MPWVVAVELGTSVAVSSGSGVEGRLMGDDGTLLGVNGELGKGVGDLPERWNRKVKEQGVGGKFSLSEELAAEPVLEGSLDWGEFGGVRSCWGISTMFRRRWWRRRRRR